jgi:hypothetical protein
MPQSWDPETYRQRAKEWHVKAAELPAGSERDACVALAEGYMHLAALIEKSQSQP